MSDYVRYGDIFVIQFYNIENKKVNPFMDCEDDNGNFIVSWDFGKQQLPVIILDKNMEATNQYVITDQEVYFGIYIDNIIDDQHLYYLTKNELITICDNPILGISKTNPMPFTLIIQSGLGDPERIPYTKKTSTGHHISILTTDKKSEITPCGESTGYGWLCDKTVVIADISNNPIFPNKFDFVRYGCHSDKTGKYTYGDYCPNSDEFCQMDVYPSSNIESKKCLPKCNSITGDGSCDYENYYGQLCVKQGKDDKYSCQYVCGEGSYTPDLGDNGYPICINENEICDNRTCVLGCSERYPNGFCHNNKVCGEDEEGVTRCLDECGVSYGYCENEQDVCELQSSGKFECIEIECQGQNYGVCPLNQECICDDDCECIEIECQGQNYGVCPSNQECICDDVCECIEIDTSKLHWEYIVLIILSVIIICLLIIYLIYRKKDTYKMSDETEVTNTDT